MYVLKKILHCFTRSFWVSQPWELIRRQEEAYTFMCTACLAPYQTSVNIFFSLVNDLKALN